MGPSLSVLFLCVFLRGGRFPVEPWTRLHCSELYWRCPVVLPAVQSGAPECSKACPHGSLCGFSVLLWPMAHSVGEWLCLEYTVAFLCIRSSPQNLLGRWRLVTPVWVSGAGAPNHLIFDRFSEQVLQQCEGDLCIPTCSITLEVLTSPCYDRNIICLSWPYWAGQAFSHRFTHGLSVLGTSHVTVSASAHTMLQAVSALLPVLGGK